MALAMPFSSLKELYRFINAHVQHVVNVFHAVGNLQHFFLKSPAIAYFADQVHIGQELHFYHLFAFTFTGIAAATIYIKGIVFGLKARAFSPLAALHTDPGSHRRL